MKISNLFSGASIALSVFLTACGGGDGSGGAGNPSQVTGNIASIAGNYTVTVSLSDCDPADNDATTTFLAVSPGVCRITTTNAGVARVETRKDLLAAGVYRLTVGSDGSLSAGGFTRQCTGNCVVTGPANNTVYVISDGGLVAGNAVVGSTLIIFDTTANPKTALGLFYGSSSQITGSTLGASESGIIAFE